MFIFIKANFYEWSVFVIFSVLLKKKIINFFVYVLSFCKVFLFVKIPLKFRYEFYRIKIFSLLNYLLSDALDYIVLKDSFTLKNLPFFFLFNFQSLSLDSILNLSYLSVVYFSFFVISLASCRIPRMLQLWINKKLKRNLFSVYK